MKGFWFESTTATTGIPILLASRKGWSNSEIPIAKIRSGFENRFPDTLCKFGQDQEVSNRLFVFVFE